jgi:hypothetical protein
MFPRLLRSLLVDKGKLLEGFAAKALIFGLIETVFSCPTRDSLPLLFQKKLICQAPKILWVLGGNLNRLGKS